MVKSKEFCSFITKWVLFTQIEELLVKVSTQSTLNTDKSLAMSLVAYLEAQVAYLVKKINGKSKQNN